MTNTLKNIISKQPSWALINMIQALSSLSLLNTKDDEKMLREAKKELRKRAERRGLI